MTTPNETHLRAAHSLDSLADAYSRPDRIKMFAEELADVFPITQERAYLSDLLAVIHRDGGHYEDEHGIEKAFNDALAKLTEHYLPAVQSPAPPALTGGDAELVMALYQMHEWAELSRREYACKAADRITALSAQVAELSAELERKLAASEARTERLMAVAARLAIERDDALERQMTIRRPIS